MKKSNLISLFGFCLLFLLLPCNFAFALEEYETEEDESRAYNVTRIIKTVDGLKFAVQEDMPIAKVAGVYRPIDMDSYVALKFGKLQKRIDKISIDMQQKIDDLAKKLDLLSEKVDALATQPVTELPSEPSSEQPSEPSSK